MKKALLFACAGLFVGTAQAAQYGMAGCGLGSIVLGDKKGMMQIFAGTTNGTFGTQTFGISSGTSNCLDGSTRSAAVFIEANKVALANDIARGQGETLATLSAIYGCRDTNALGKTLQKNYGQIYASSESTPLEVGQSITNIIKSEDGTSCEV